MTITELLKPDQLVVGPDGEVAAVQINIKNWRELLEQLETLEDRAIVRTALKHLEIGPQQAGALQWDSIRDTWDDAA